MEFSVRAAELTTPKTISPESAIRKNILLSHVERPMSNYLVRISIVLCVLAICCCLSQIMGCVDLFQAVFWKIAFSLGGRALLVTISDHRIQEWGVGRLEE